VAIQVHRHRRSRVPEHPLNHIRVGASGQPHRRCSMTQIMNAEAGGTPTADVAALQPTRAWRRAWARHARLADCRARSNRDTLSRDRSEC
jgi:hypothetical protein